MKKRFSFSIVLGLAVPFFSYAMEKGEEQNSQAISLISSSAKHTVPNIQDFSPSVKRQISSVQRDLEDGRPLSEIRLENLNRDMLEEVRDNSGHRWNVAYGNNKGYFGSILSHVAVPVSKDGEEQGYLSLEGVAKKAHQDNVDCGKKVYIPKVDYIAGAFICGTVLGTGIAYLKKTDYIKYVLVGGAALAGCQALFNVKMERDKRNYKASNVSNSFMQSESQRLGTIPVYNTFDTEFVGINGDCDFVDNREKSSFLHNEEGEEKKSSEKRSSFIWNYKEIYELDANLSEGKPFQEEDKPLLVTNSGFVITNWDEYGHEEEGEGDDGKNKRYVVNRFQPFDDDSKYHYRVILDKVNPVPSTMSNQKSLQEAYDVREKAKLYVIQKNKSLQAECNAMSGQANRFSNHDRHQQSKVSSFAFSGCASDSE